MKHTFMKAKKLLCALLAAIMVVSTAIPAFAVPSAVEAMDNAEEHPAQTTNADNTELSAMGEYGGNITGAKWYWPFHGFDSTSSAYSQITSSYGYRGSEFESYHRGVDIKATMGTPVYAVRSGTVYSVHSSTSGDAGRYIIINHNDGYYSIYMHLSKINVSTGQSVNQYTQIGSSGASGKGYESYYGYGEHLHLGIHYGSSWDSECSVNPCPSGYERIGSSLQESNGGFPIGTPSISYSVTLCPNCDKAGTSDFSYTGDGICTECETAYNYTATATTDGITPGIYDRTDANNYQDITVRTTPYAHSSNNIVLTNALSFIEVVSVVTSADGGKWYKITANGTDTGFGYVVAYKVDADYTYRGPASQITITPTSYPTGTIQAAPFSLKGTITSKYNIKSVEGKIINSSTGSTVTSATDYPNTTSYNISGSKIDSSIKFGSLSSGTYKLVYIVTDVEGTVEDWESAPFNVSTASATTYTITFNANGGTWSQGNLTKTHNVTATIPNVYPVRIGYTFIGWSKQLNGSPVYYSGSQVTENASFTLYAQWTPNKPASPTLILNKTEYYENEAVNLSWNDVQYADYYEIFILDKDTGDTEYVNWKVYGTSYSFSDIVPGTYLARLSAINSCLIGSGEIYYCYSNEVEFTVKTATTHTVTFDANGGTGAPASQTVVYGGTVTYPSQIPTRAGYKFAGWKYTDSGSVITLIYPGAITSVYRDMTFYAMWESIPIPNAPSYITASPNKTVYSTSETITFTWPAVENATDYVVNIWKNDTEHLYCNYTDNSTSFIYVPSSVGNYEIRVESGNASGFNTNYTKYNFIVANTIPDSNLLWYIDSAGCLRILGSGAMPDFDYSTAPWYGDRSTIKSVVIGAEVERIGKYAFNGCSNLASIIIPDNVTSFGTHTFYNCKSLTSITIPHSVTSISDYAFYECTSLTSIIIPNSITSIGERVFGYCSALSSITIPHSVTSIGGHAFFACSNLTSITIPDSVISIGGYAFSSCKSLTSITIPDSVTSIGGGAFYKCSNLTSITIPDGVTNIGGSAFSGCSNLTSITIPNGVTSIGVGAFSGCSNLTSITIPDGVKSISDSAFSECSSLTSITIPDGVTSIGVGAFSGCSNLTSITIPDGVTIIDSSAFRSCTSLVSITIPDSVKTISTGAFSYCKSLTSITIPDNVKGLGNAVFSGCSSLTSITIPDGVIGIGWETFEGCSSLTSITIPDSVTSIGDWAFYRCTSLASITIPNSVTSIGNYAFSRCTSLKGITIPDSVTSIGDWAFYECTSLASITIPDGVKSIGSSAFYNCSSLTDVYFGGTQTSWNSISVESSNECLTNATIHFAEYTITYDANGGIYAPLSQTQIKGTDTWISTTAPYREGYEFVNWNTNPDGSGTSYSSGQLYNDYSGNYNDRILYAVWKSITSTSYSKLNIGKAVGKPGDTVKVEINIDNNQYIKGFVIDDFSFDEANLEFVGFEASDDDIVSDAYYSGFGDDKNITVFYKNESVYSGKVCDALFKVKENTEYGEYPIYASAKMSIDSQGIRLKLNNGSIIVSNIEGVSLDKTSAKMTVSETLTLTATVLPENAANKNVVWTSSNDSIATVTDGVVTAKSAGTATITATTGDGNKTATCVITVTNPPSKNAPSTMNNYHSIKTQGVSGMRFHAQVPTSHTASAIGWIVTTKDILDKAGINNDDFTKDCDVLYVKGENYNKDEGKNVIFNSDGGVDTFSAVLTGVTAENYDMVIVARPYVIDDDGTWYGQPYAMSVKNVAQVMKDSGEYDSFADDQKAVIEAILSGQEI